MRRKLWLSYILFFCFAVCMAQKGDTIRVMQYNLLYYDSNTGWCSPSNNSADSKDEYLRTITSHYKPHIFTVNEMNGDVVSVDRILNNVFNIDNIKEYKRANYTGSGIVNMLYYNSSKLELKSQAYILTSPRITDVYKLYFKNSQLVEGDTTFLTCFVSHLKAGSSSTDAIERADATATIMAYINNNGLSGNMLIMGDFNLYSSSEAAFQNLTTATPSGVCFFDPIESIGDWHDNPNFASVHTQSTNTGTGCPSGGGMDDRFDFILASKPVMEGTDRVKYVKNSYAAMGQDGLRLNYSLVEPANGSLPNNLVNALFRMSDHLPVVLKLYVSPKATSAPKTIKKKEEQVRVENPLGNLIKITSLNYTYNRVNLTVTNSQGSIVLKCVTDLPSGVNIEINASDLAPGLYVIHAAGKNLTFVSRLVKL